MLSAIAFSNVFEHYLGDDMKRENPPVEDSSDEDDKRNTDKHLIKGLFLN